MKDMIKKNKGEENNVVERVKKTETRTKRNIILTQIRNDEIRYSYT